MRRRMARPALLRRHSVTPVSVTTKHRLTQGVRVRVISKDAVGTNAYDAFGILGIRVKCHGIDLMDILSCTDWVKNKCVRMCTHLHI